MVLKPANKYQIIWQWWFTALSVSLLSKSFGNIIFLQSQKYQIEEIRQLTVQIFVYYLIYSGARKAFLEIIQHKAVWFAL